MGSDQVIHVGKNDENDQIINEDVKTEIETETKDGMTVTTTTTTKTVHYASGKSRTSVETAYQTSYSYKAGKETEADAQARMEQQLQEIIESRRQKAEQQKKQPRRRKVDSPTSQVRQYRNNMKNKQRSKGPKPILTLSNMEQRSREGQAFVEKSNESMQPQHIIKMGKDALKYTNEFRATQNLPPCKWNQTMFDAGMEHSIFQAKEKAISHKNFQERTQKFPPGCMGFAENVFFCSGLDDPSRAAVDGWIKSPGHRRNMVGDYNLCSISAYCEDNTWYYTQLFGKR
ncbi:hypothetical protein PCE1_004790 [Barthelona sp. PCE]